MVFGSLLFLAFAVGTVGPRLSFSGSGDTGKVSSLQARVDSLEQRVLSSQEKRKELRQALSAHKEKLESLEQQLQGSSYRKVQVQNAILDLNNKVDRALSYRIADHVAEASVKKGFDPFLVISVMHVESNFDPHARSGVGARGLMQVMPSWCPTYEIRSRELWEIKTNIETGVSILDACMKECENDLRCALAKYHGSYPRYYVYADKVLDVYEDLVEEYEPDPERSMLEELKKHLGKHARLQDGKLCTPDGQCMEPL